MLHRIGTAEPDLDGVPESLRPLLAECLGKDPARRPSSRDVAMRLIDPLSHPSPDITRPQPPVPGPPVPVPMPPAPPLGGASPHGPATDPAPIRNLTQPRPQPPVPGATPAGGGGKSTRVIVGAAAAVIVAIACATAVLLLNRDDGSPTPGSATSQSPTSSAPTPSASESTGSSPGGGTGGTGGPGGTGPAGALPAAFGGTWTGALTQTGGITIGDSSTNVTIHLTAGQKSGTADYDAWGCHNKLEVTDVSGGTAEFQETVETNNGSAGFCTGGTISLEQVSGGLKYTSRGIGTTSGVLRKTG
jgi:hypothetical protein